MKFLKVRGGKEKKKREKIYIRQKNTKQENRYEYPILIPNVYNARQR